MPRGWIGEISPFSVVVSVGWCGCVLVCSASSDCVVFRIVIVGGLGACGVELAIRV